MTTLSSNTAAWIARNQRRMRPARASRPDSPAVLAALASVEASGKRAAAEIAQIQASVGVTADRPLFGRYGEVR